MDITPYLKLMVDKNASDLFFHVGAPVNIKIGGYTDNVGDPQTNLKISGERAKATLQALVGMGIGAGRMEAEGYGEQHPVADNSTDQGRQKNRRVDIRVTAK